MTTRPLTTSEAELLRRVLSRSFPGAQELLAQVDHAVVTGERIGFRDLHVSPEVEASTAPDGPVPVRAW